MSGEYVIALGNRAFAAGNFSQAIKMYSLSLEQDGLDVVCMCNRSAAYCALDLFQHALKDAQKCIEVDPGFTKGWLRASQAFAALGQHQEAKDCLQNLLFYGGDIDDYVTATGSQVNRASSVVPSPSPAAQSNVDKPSPPAPRSSALAAPASPIAPPPAQQRTPPTPSAADETDTHYALASLLAAAHQSLGDGEAEDSFMPSPDSVRRPAFLNDFL
jgi:tetratricopeptide (TPR) repeat protein